MTYGPEQPGREYEYRRATAEMAETATAQAACNCEHASHFDGTAHEYGAVRPGIRVAQHVGTVCDDCANGHLIDYVMPELTLSPADHIANAVKLYRANTRTATQGETFAFLTFPNMHAATSWANAAEISGSVRLFMQHSSGNSTAVGYLSEPVTVIYEF